MEKWSGDIIFQSITNRNSCRNKEKSISSQSLPKGFELNPQISEPYETNRFPGIWNQSEDEIETEILPKDIEGNLTFSIEFKGTQLI